MITARYSSIEAAVARRLQWPAGELDTDEFEQIRDAASEAMGEAWRFAWWTFLLVTEQRTFAPRWETSATYQAGAVVYHEGADQYFEALAADVTSEPATLTGDTWETDDFWAIWGSTSGASNYSDLTGYSPGDVVYYPTDRRHYQCHTATSPGDLPTDALHWGLLGLRENRIDGDELGFPVIGHVLRVTTTNPEKDLGAVRVDHRMSRGDVVVFGRTPNQPWIQYLPVAPRLTGSPWDPTLSYGPAVTTTDDDMPLEGYAGFAQLRARTQHSDRQMAYCFFGVVEGDNLGGWFRYIGSSALADENADKIRPTDNPLPSLGCWERTS